MKRQIALCLFFGALAVIPVFAERVAMPQFDIPTAAANGFGGSYTAYTDNVFSLLVNPAAMMRVQQRSFFTLATSVFSPQSLFGITSSLMNIDASHFSGSFGDIADTLSEKEGRIAIGFELREFPFSIAWVANGFGFGLWSRSFVKAEIIGDYVRVNAYSDVILPVGFAFKILEMERHSVDAGFTLKPFVRVIASENVVITDLLDDATIDPAVPLLVGGGFDIGFLYRWAAGLQVGFTFKDIFTRGAVAANLTENKDASKYYVPFTMNAGVSYSARPFYFLGLTVAADWRDLGNIFNQNDYLNNRNCLLDFGMGLEVSFFDSIYLRAGMKELLPAAGLGFSLGPVKIDLAYYGRQFGYEPGQLSTAVADLSIAIRPDAKQRNWKWTRGSLLGLFGAGNR